MDLPRGNKGINRAWNMHKKGDKGGKRGKKKKKDFSRASCLWAGTVDCLGPQIWVIFTKT